MRKSLLYAGCVMFALAAGTSAAMAQSDFLDSVPSNPDPVPLTKPLYSPDAATALSAVDSPTANVGTRFAATHTAGMVPCSQINPCAIATPLISSRGS